MRTWSVTLLSFMTGSGRRLVLHLSCAPPLWMRSPGFLVSCVNSGATPGVGCPHAERYPRQCVEIAGCCRRSDRRRKRKRYGTAVRALVYESYGRLVSKGTKLLRDLSNDWPGRTGGAARTHSGDGGPSWSVSCFPLRQTPSCAHWGQGWQLHVRSAHQLTRPLCRKRVSAFFFCLLCGPRCQTRDTHVKVSSTETETERQRDRETERQTDRDRLKANHSQPEHK